MRVLKILLLIGLLMGLVACGSQAGPEPASDAPATSEDTADDASAEEDASDDGSEEASEDASDDESDDASEDEGEDDGEQASSPDKVTIRLSWKIKGEFAPPFVAAAEGCFADEGVDVEVLEGSGAGAVIQSLVAGNDQIGYLDAPAMVLGVHQDIPVIMVANYLKRLPMILVANPDVTLEGPADLEGKQLAVSPFDSFTRLLPTFTSLHDLDLDSIEQVNLETSIWQQSLLSGQIDIMPAFQTNDYYTLLNVAPEDAEFDTLELWEYGLDMLGHGLVVSESYLEENPDTVRAVIRGMNCGVQLTMEDPENAADILVEQFPEALDRDVVLQQIDELGNFMGETENLGVNTQDAWDQTLDLMVDSEQIDSRRSDEEYYTNEYLPE
ncbi:MAG: ABC transporter substrate-binding protein [Chloroflexota bacterium]